MRKILLLLSIILVVLLIGCGSPSYVPGGLVTSKIPVETTYLPLEEGAPPGKIVTMDDYPIVVEGKLTGDILFSSYTDPYPRIIHISKDGTIWAYGLDTQTIGRSVAITDIRLLPNGHYLILAPTIGIVEVTREGETVGFFKDRLPTHHAEILPNGNLLVASGPASKVYEVNPWSREIIWKWIAEDEILPYSDETYVDFDSTDFKVENVYEGYRVGFGTPTEETKPRNKRDWTHVNYVQKLPSGNYLLSLRNFSLVIEVDPRQDNKVVWSFGPLVLKHQHTPVYLDSGNILIYDNGGGRVIEVSRDHKIVWEYSNSYSGLEGSNVRVPSGNTVIADTTSGRIYEVTPEGKVLWTIREKEGYPQHSFYRAYWYPSND